MDGTEDRIRTRKETADRLRVSVRTLSRMERGDLPARIKISDRIFGYRESSINQFLASRTAA